MKTSRTLALTLPLLLASMAAVAQERSRPKKPPTFAELHAAVKEQFEAGSYGKAYASARELLALVGRKRAEGIRAALPKAPAGYEIVAPEPEDETTQDAALLGAMTAGVGNVVEQEYSGSKGSIRVTVTADSPMLAMAKMMFENPALIGPDAEVVKYDQCKAVLRKDGDSWQLQILVENTMIDAQFDAENDEFALKMFDQAAVTAIYRAIVD